MFTSNKVEGIEVEGEEYHENPPAPEPEPEKPEKPQEEQEKDITPKTGVKDVLEISIAVLIVTSLTAFILRRKEI